ncbi:hypothetical protein [Palleronia sp.]|uniref:spike base protein, RCAP_Rcc01079 family n=1 Tax=Palleronia sp. TaxID=1940284 RepID=UPI0035C7FD81
MTDTFSSHMPGLSSPAESITSIVPDDNVDLPYATRAINVSNTGNVRITTVSGTTETLFIAAGIAFPVRAKRVWFTGTDAAGIRGLF